MISCKVIFDSDGYKCSFVVVVVVVVLVVDVVELFHGLFVE